MWRTFLLSKTSFFLCRKYQRVCSSSWRNEFKTQEPGFLVRRGGGGVALVYDDWFWRQLKCAGLGRSSALLLAWPCAGLQATEASAGIRTLATPSSRSGPLLLYSPLNGSHLACSSPFLIVKLLGKIFLFGTLCFIFCLIVCLCFQAFEYIVLLSPGL